MVILQSLALATLFVFLGGNALRKRPALCYAAAALLALTAVWGVWSGAFGALPAWATRYLTPMLTKGALAAALFFYVMFAGAVPNGSAFMRRVMPIRGQLSIVASILAVGHGAALLRAQLGHALAAKGNDALALAALGVSLLLMAVMLPLSVTSFKRVRKAMRPRAWKGLQRFAYAFYALLLAHILLYNLPKARNGALGARINAVVYGALFCVYAGLRARKALQKRHAQYGALPVIAAACALCAILAVAFVPQREATASAAQAEALQAQVELLQARADELQAQVEELTARIGALESAQLAPTQEPTPEPTLEPEAESSPWADGKYSGAGIGYNGRLTVSVTIENGKIDQIRLTGTVDDEEYVEEAEEATIHAVVAAQSAQVDAVSGATSTSEGMLEAIQDALEKAAG